MLQGLVIGSTKLLKWAPLVRGVLTHKDLAWVALPSKVYLLGIDLVGNVDQEYIKEVI